ncbi:unnamed protein product [Caenorhabditis auriculariae]|uniref:NADP-dependent oxidoreductase domain-containing protein n=1 Tax=Caenorhabditis auriculariae TaxID=2777116 RepID=A0A8S1GR53_9PELO|nr:unnamed protein product [Caenorhabditis auriculariae]
MPLKIRMSNGVDVPFIGLGTGGKPTDEEELEEALRTALTLGYRHIDTAHSYGTEKVIGKVLQDFFNEGKITREQIFVTTKLACTAHRFEDVQHCLRSQLADLQLGYVDLYLVHSPCAMQAVPKSEGETKLEPLNIDICETWRGMEAVFNQGLTRSIGVSNFNVEQIQQVYSTAKVKPHNLQIEIHLHWPQKELITLCNALHITVTAYAPLGCPGKKKESHWPDVLPLDEPILQVLSEKYHRTPAQILLRHLTQRNIIVIPKSTNGKRLKENLESTDFFLADEDIEKLNHIPSKCRLYRWRERTSHPRYPFTDD